jgi:dUTP pyrophosphatase
VLFLRKRKSKLQLKIKRLKETAKLPTRSYSSDAGLDLYACIEKDIDISAIINSFVVIPLGIAIEIPTGYYGHLVGRSGLASRGVFSHQGTIDSGYRGELNAILYTTIVFSEPIIIHSGDRIAQLIILKHESPEVIEVESLSLSPRQTKGLGSTGR